MKTNEPKILPWLAHKAGISMARAATLWQAAEQHAARACGAGSGNRYYQLAMDRLLELVAAESLREDAASFGWRRWARQHARQCQGLLQVMDALTLNNLRGWRSLKPIQF